MGRRREIWAELLGDHLHTLTPYIISTLYSSTGGGEGRGKGEGQGREAEGRARKSPDLTTVVFIGTIVTIVHVIALPRHWHTIRAIKASKVGPRTGRERIERCDGEISVRAVFFVRVIATVVVGIAVPPQRNAPSAATGELVVGTRTRRRAALFVAVVAAVVVAVADPRGRDAVSVTAGERPRRAGREARIKRGGMVTIPLVRHIPTVVVEVAPPGIGDATVVIAAELVATATRIDTVCLVGGIVAVEVVVAMPR